MRKSVNRRVKWKKTGGMWLENFCQKEGPILQVQILQEYGRSSSLPLYMEYNLLYGYLCSMKGVIQIVKHNIIAPDAEGLWR